MTPAERLRVAAIVNELTAIKDSCTTDLDARWDKMVTEVPGEFAVSGVDLATYTAVATELAVLDAGLAVLKQL